MQSYEVNLGQFPEFGKFQELSEHPLQGNNNNSS